ncbi:hypothetical protein GRW28_25765, partial [Escherichia coli]|nr:hypothetical protein [Escherichia coli]
VTDYLRFLARWQHVAPGTQVSTPAGLVQVIAQLQGWEAAVAAWEPEILAARVRGYDGAWIDRLCHDGELQWLRLSPRPGDTSDRRGAGPSKATPIGLVLRDDLPWLLAAVRGDQHPAVPAAGPVAEIAEVLA